MQWESNKLSVSIATSMELLLGERDQNWNDIRKDFGRIARLVSYYEVREATSTFELALWKSKLDQADAINTVTSVRVLMRRVV